MGQSILVIDDDLDFTLLLNEVLTARGHQVEVAQNASQATGTFSSFLPDLVLLDLSLGTSSGIELGTQLRSLTSKVFQLVAVTGWSDARTEKAVREAGFDGFLPKPLDFKQLDDLLRASELET